MIKKEQIVPFCRKIQLKQLQQDKNIREQLESHYKQLQNKHNHAQSVKSQKNKAQLVEIICLECIDKKHALILLYVLFFFEKNINQVFNFDHQSKNQMRRNQQYNEDSIQISFNKMKLLAKIIQSNCKQIQQQKQNIKTSFIQMYYVNYMALSHNLELIEEVFKNVQQKKLIYEINLKLHKLTKLGSKVNSQIQKKQLQSSNQTLCSERSTIPSKPDSQKLNSQIKRIQYNNEVILLINLKKKYCIVIFPSIQLFFELVAKISPKINKSFIKQDEEKNLSQNLKLSIHQNFKQKIQQTLNFINILQIGIFLLINILYVTLKINFDNNSERIQQFIGCLYSFIKTQNSISIISQFLFEVLIFNQINYFKTLILSVLIN